MIARTYANIGISYLEKGKIDSATYYCYIAINNFKGEKYSSLKAVSYNRLSMIYRKADIYDKSLAFA